MHTHAHRHTHTRTQAQTILFKLIHSATTTLINSFKFRQPWCAMSIFERCRREINKRGGEGVKSFTLNLNWRAREEVNWNVNCLLGIFSIILVRLILFTKLAFSFYCRIKLKYRSDPKFHVCVSVCVSYNGNCIIFTFVHRGPVPVPHQCCTDVLTTTITDSLGIKINWHQNKMARRITLGISAVGEVRPLE